MMRVTAKLNPLLLFFFTAILGGECAVFSVIRIATFSAHANKVNQNSGDKSPTILTPAEAGLGKTPTCDSSDFPDDQCTGS